MQDSESADKKKAYDKEWARRKRESDPEGVRAKDREKAKRYRNDPEKREQILARDRARYARNRERIRAKTRAWYAANVNGIREKARADYRKRYDGGEMRYRLRAAFHAARARARMRGIQFDLQLADLGSPTHCAVTGIEFNMTRSFRQGNIFVPSLDRIDPTLGYVRGNVRVVCHGYNLAKHTGTDSDVLKLARALVRMFPE